MLHFRQTKKICARTKEAALGGSFVIKPTLATISISADSDKHMRCHRTRQLSKRHVARFSVRFRTVPVALVTNLWPITPTTDKMHAHLW